MANYKNHVRFNLLLALPLLVICIWYWIHPDLSKLLLFSLCFVLATLFLNPDLDLAYKIKLFSLRGVLTFPFRFYSMIFRHRGISHHPLFGTLSRLAWGGGCYWALTLLFSIHTPTLFSWTELVYVLSGIFAADLCHLLLD
jgi:uncharacterized metal-binding protein